MASSTKTDTESLLFLDIITNLHAWRSQFVDARKEKYILIAEIHPGGSVCKTTVSEQGGKNLSKVTWEFIRDIYEQKRKSKFKQFLKNIDDAVKLPWVESVMVRVMTNGDTFIMPLSKEQFEKVWDVIEDTIREENA